MSEAARQALRAYEAESWRRWEMDSVEPVALEDQVPLPDEHATLTQQLEEEIARLKREAREEGRAQGHAEGMLEGLRQGKEQGRVVGLEEGRAEGFEAGMKDALEQGTHRIDAQVQHLVTLLESGSQA